MNLKKIYDSIELKKSSLLEALKKQPWYSKPTKQDKEYVEEIYNVYFSDPSKFSKVATSKVSKVKSIEAQNRLKTAFALQSLKQLEFYPDGSGVFIVSSL